MLGNTPQEWSLTSSAFWAMLWATLPCFTPGCLPNWSPQSTQYSGTSSMSNNHYKCVVKCVVQLFMQSWLVMLLRMDFGFFSPNDGGNKWLREELVYPGTHIYYAIIIEDIAIRLSWVVGLALSKVIKENNFSILFYINNFIVHKSSIWGDCMCTASSWSLQVGKNQKVFLFQDSLFDSTGGLCGTLFVLRMSIWTTVASSG